MMQIKAKITSYNVRNDAVEEIETIQTFDLRYKIDYRGQGWVVFVRGPQGIRIESLSEAIERGGWYAQSGTKPVYVPPCPHPEDSHSCCGRTCESPNGGWGGRNYPEIFVDVDELRRIQDELSKEGV